jgi:hypothetical protein
MHRNVTLRQFIVVTSLNKYIKSFIKSGSLKNLLNFFKYSWELTFSADRKLWYLTVRSLENLVGSYSEAQDLLGCTAVFLIEFRPTFQRYVLPPSSGRLTVICILY